jgi:hypothetical protein
VVGTLHSVDPNTGEPIRKNYDLDFFKYEYNRLFWNGSLITSEAASLDVNYTASEAGRYIVVHVWQFGELASVLGYANAYPNMNPDTSRIDPNRHEHFLVPGRMVGGVNTDVYPNETNSDFSDATQRPTLPWDPPTPVSPEDF